MISAASAKGGEVVQDTPQTGRGPASGGDRSPEASHQRHECAKVHYKVCSTFDSSPDRGSIGAALEVGMSTTGSRTCPIVIGAPHLGRYVAFGNLFARSGSAPTIHRIDRHPTMSVHPATPMTEADLVRHLAKQTGCVVQRSTVVESPLLWSADPEGRPVVLFDVVTESDLQAVGEAVWRGVEAGATRFAIGSSGLNDALATAWDSRFPERVALPVTKASEVSQLLVLSGSCSPVTAEQIRAAEASGYVTIAVSTDAAARDLQQETAKIAERVLQALRERANVIVYTCLGPEDDSYDANLAANGPDDVLGRLLGVVANVALKNTDVRRLLVCGGDTSGTIGRQIGLDALTFLAPLSPGAPLCLGHRADGDSIEIAFKGGQMGEVGYFEAVRGSTQ